MLPSAFADARSSDDVIAFEGNGYGPDPESVCRCKENDYAKRTKILQPHVMAVALVAAEGSGVAAQTHYNHIASRDF